MNSISQSAASVVTQAPDPARQPPTTAVSVRERKRQESEEERDTERGENKRVLRDSERQTRQTDWRRESDRRERDRATRERDTEKKEADR